MNKILSYLSGIIAFLIGLFGLYFFGKKQGRKDEEQKNTEESLKTVKKVKKQVDTVDGMSYKEIREELKEFTKD